MKSAVLFLGLLLAISAVNQAAATGVIGALKDIHEAKAKLLQKFAPPPPSPPAAKVVPSPPVAPVVFISGPRGPVAVPATALTSPIAVQSPPTGKVAASPPPPRSALAGGK